MNEHPRHVSLAAWPLQAIRTGSVLLGLAVVALAPACGGDGPPGGGDGGSLADAPLIIGTDAGPDAASGDASLPDGVGTETAMGDVGVGGDEDSGGATDGLGDGGLGDSVQDVAQDVAQDAGAQDVPPLPDVDPDAPCTPSCEGKTCGPDGCGGICGYCAYPDICDPEGQCVDFCQPQCEGKFCGPDGCGGTCGSCEEGLECKEDGLCYEPACVPDCSNKYCGPDGCGSTCGECAWPEVCIDWGCGLGPCGTVDADGACDGDVLMWCENLTELKTDDCTQYPGYTCAYDPFQNKYSCVEKAACVPQCEGKVCGDDGCGGSCGACATGWSCTQGACTPEPGAACANHEIGLCVGDTLWSCSGGKIYPEDCTVFGQHCGWSPPDSAYNCVD